jgi:choline-sulfatase/uncharacterized sulfatase
MYSPGQIKPGTVVTEALSNIDFLPTVMSLLKVPHDLAVDGRDASGLLTGRRPADWKDITIVRGAGRSGETGNAWLSAITSRFKLVFSVSEEPWLIDLKHDPNELTNLFGQAEHRDTVRWMTEELQSYGKTHREPYVRNPRIRSWMDQVLATGTK